MKKSLLFSLLIFLTSLLCNAKIVYVSSSLGDDSRDGETSLTPLKTISAAQRKADTVLLKSGDRFYEDIIVRRGLISKYGGKELPIICGYKRINEPCWERVRRNVWRICLAEDNYSGYHTKGSSMMNNIGCLHEWDRNLIHGRKLQYKHQLKEDWDIWQTEHHKKEETLAQDFDSLYLFLGENPNILKIEFSVGKAAVVVSGATLENIRIEGFGFGVSAGANTVIRNCEIDAIGGMTQITDREFICYGNGIEFWINKDLSDCLVQGNKISRCYDCACTIQGRDSAVPTNICFKNNVIVDCCQGWEDFLTNDDSSAVFYQCVFENNLVLNSGRSSGFGYPNSRFKYCHVLGANQKGFKGMIIRNNTFVGGNYYCSASFHEEYKSNLWQDNICVIKRGDYILSYYFGTKDVIRIPTDKGEFRTISAATESAIKRYRELTGDQTTRFVIKSDRTINRKIKRYKKRFFE